MKHLFILFLAFKTVLSFGQNATMLDTIPQPVYDTTNIEVKSTNSFYFCSKLYKIPRDCDVKDQSNCCSYRTCIRNGKIVPNTTNIECNDGTTLYWTNFDNVEPAKNKFNNFSNRLQKHVKNFKQEKVKLLLCNKDVIANKLCYITPQGYTFTEIIFYGTINGESIFGELNSQKKLNSSKALNALFQQIVRF
jgi:hypothetical protein